ncbi:YusW family protein [Alkalicoccobacillus porphyridii]|nr:YusW family protein [Alkalicoccobacillus porphyridii]
MYRSMIFIIMLGVLFGCQQQEQENDSTRNQANQGPPASIQKVPDSTQLIQELTLQVVYQNGEEVRVHYVQGEEEQWMYHNDLAEPSTIEDEELYDKLNQLTIDKGTFTEEVIQQMRYVFEFGGVYDVLDLEITFDDGTTRQYES